MIISMSFFYHIQIHHKHNEDDYKVNLSEPQLLTRIVEPYMDGQPIVINGRSIKLDLINRISIYKTKDKQEYDNDPSPYKRLGAAPEWLAIETGAEVTDEFITGPPGIKRASKEVASDSPAKHDVSTNKIFISHSSKDIEYVKSFTEHILRLGLDISSERIFCSSMEGHGVKSGQYIPDRLKEEVKKSSLALLFISKNYKTSEVCLNEIGAAWATLPKENVIPLLLPNTDFSEIGFLDLNRLGLKISERGGILKLIQDCKEQLNVSFNLEKLHAKIEDFLEDIKIFQLSIDAGITEKDKEVSEWTDCFENNLYPLNEIIRRAIPAHDDGIHRITDAKIQIQILTDLSKAKFLSDFWYKHAGGDFYVEKMRRMPSGNWLISGFNWELKVSDMWVCIDSELQYEFVLIKSEKQEAFKIDSDIGGTAYNVGVLPDGTIVSENERLNGYAIIKGETINLFDFGVEPRIRDAESHWIFLVSDYHKAGFNADETIAFCKKLDSGEIEVSAESIYEFLRPLRNNPVVIMYR